MNGALWCCVRHALTTVEATCRLCLSDARRAALRAVSPDDGPDSPSTLTVGEVARREG